MACIACSLAAILRVLRDGNFTISFAGGDGNGITKTGDNSDMQMIFVGV